MTKASTLEPRPAAQPKTLALQKPVNRLIRGMLRTPLVSRAIGKRLLTVYVVGRKTGRKYAVPVAYTRCEGSLLIGTPFPRSWVRNLRTGEDVEIRLHGRRRPADVEVIADEAGVLKHYGLLARDNHQFAKFNKIGFDPEGNPSVAELRHLWSIGARAVRLTPR
jgi:deazaflavin-dependent oxidoreductase (nitroreductase family)